LINARQKAAVALFSSRDIKKLVGKCHTVQMQTGTQCSTPMLASRLLRALRQRSLHVCFALCANARFTLDAQRFIPTLDAERSTLNASR